MQYSYTNVKQPSSERNRTVASVSQYPNVLDRIKIPCATEIVGKLHERNFADTLRGAVQNFSGEILSELNVMGELRVSDAKEHAQRCLLFAICSPQLDFDVNVRVARRAYDGLYRDFASVEDVYQWITADNSDSWFLAGAAARAIFHNLAWLRNVDETDMDKGSILALRKAGKLKGLGPKTAAMAMALYDPESEVYTLDVHMLRGILSAVGMHDRLAMGQEITDAAYPILEAALIQLHRGIYGDSLPIFVSQWSLWSQWRSGEHIPHIGIFA